MDNCENLFDWSRTLLERVGYRMGLDSIVILLTGSKIGQLMSNGTELQNVNVSMQDLYLKPESNPYKATGRRDVCHQRLKLLVLNRHFVNFPDSQLAVSLLPVYCMNCSW